LIPNQQLYETPLIQNPTISAVANNAEVSFRRLCFQNSGMRFSALLFPHESLLHKGTDRGRSRRRVERERRKKTG
jgi:hypothetical protein